MARFILSIVCLVVASSGNSQNSVTFCDLLRNPDKYNGQEVSVRATYRYGFEWQELFCLDCKDKGKAWLEVPFELDNAAVRPLRRAPKGAGVVNLTLQGVFVTGNHHFGHMGMYPYKFVVHRVTDIAVVSKGMKTLAEEEKAEGQWACGGSHPK
jgi:hypothetical protein